MEKLDLPIYAIVELLIRLSSHNIPVGDYKDHAIKGISVWVKTTTGTLLLSSDLVAKQFLKPEEVNTDELFSAGNTFQPFAESA